ncbi:MAG TPA: hypothetical protein PLD59_02015 [Tepidisphaeraceae bacterium]|nr:hypothetical protein [Tepidisphaeraceae bacterium]
MKNRHEMIDQRSLAFGRVIAAKLCENPGLISLAMNNIARWQSTASPGVVATLEEWREILRGPQDCVIEVLTRGDERAVRLRQSNPFAGALTNQERNDILRAFESDDSSAT